MSAFEVGVRGRKKKSKGGRRAGREKEREEEIERTHTERDRSPTKSCRPSPRLDPPISLWLQLQRSLASTTTESNQKPKTISFSRCEIRKQPSVPNPSRAHLLRCRFSSGLVLRIDRSVQTCGSHVSDGRYRGRVVPRIRPRKKRKKNEVVSFEKGKEGEGGKRVGRRTLRCRESRRSCTTYESRPTDEAR